MTGKTWRGADPVPSRRITPHRLYDSPTDLCWQLVFPTKFSARRRRYPGKFDKGWQWRRQCRDTAFVDLVLIIPPPSIPDGDVIHWPAWPDDTYDDGQNGAKAPNLKDYIVLEGDVAFGEWQLCAHHPSRQCRQDGRPTRVKGVPHSSVNKR